MAVWEPAGWVDIASAVYFFRRLRGKEGLLGACTFGMRGRGPGADCIVIREGELPSLGVAIHAVGSTLPHEHEPGTFHGTNHPPRGQIGHQAATTT